jgi:hypothetical protein
MGVFRTDLKCFYRVMAAAVTAFTIFAISSHPVLAAEYDLNSRTYLYLYERA